MTVRLAYLVNHYPAVSHTFIRREIQALELLGMDITRIAIRGWDSNLVDPLDQEEQRRTRFILQGGVAGLLVSVLHTIATAPGSFFRTLALSFRLWRRSNRSLVYHLAYLAEACVVVRWLRGGRIVHLHAHFGTNGAEVAMLAHALGGPPYSFTVHGPEEFDRPEALSLAEKVSRASFVAVISDFARSQLYRWIAYSEWPKVHVIHCGLERAFYADAPIGTPTSTKLVCVGRLCEQKGQLLLVEAAHLLAQRGIDFQLVLAGDGDMRGVIQNAIDRYALVDRVKITGWISSSRVRDELLSSRALVLASFAEGLPVVIMEAMSLRRPVLSTYVAGIPELVIPAETGWLFPAGNAQAIADAMQSCLGATADTLTRMGEAARQRVIARHDVDREAKKLAALFHSPQPQAA